MTFKNRIYNEYMTNNKPKRIEIGINETWGVYVEKISKKETKYEIYGHYLNDTQGKLRVWITNNRYHLPLRRARK